MKDNSLLWGDAGFYWVSYYDRNIGHDATAYTADQVSNYSRIYQYDLLGMNDSLHPNWVEGFRPTYAANVFTAAANESISAVGFSNPSENYGGELESVDYQVDVCLDHAGPYPEKPNYCLAVSVKTALLYAGYYTVELPKKVPVKKGQKFMIVLSGAIRGIWGAYIGIERPDAGYSSVTAEPGQGYVSYDGKTYGDLTEVKALNYNTHQMEPLENTSLCIKAYASYGINSVAKFPEAGMPSKEDIVWSFTNENASSVLVKPVALLYRASQDSPVAFGDEVTGDYCLDSAGQHQQMIDGWVEVDPNDTITVPLETRGISRSGPGGIPLSSD